MLTTFHAIKVESYDQLGKLNFLTYLFARQDSKADSNPRHISVRRECLL